MKIDNTNTQTVSKLRKLCLIFNFHFQSSRIQRITSTRALNGLAKLYTRLMATKETFCWQSNFYFKKKKKNGEYEINGKLQGIKLKIPVLFSPLFCLCFVFVLTHSRQFGSWNSQLHFTSVVFVFVMLRSYGRCAHFNVCASIFI